MTNCDQLRDRMVSLTHGQSDWQDGEVAHLRDCTDCTAEWRLVQAGAALGRGTEVDVERVARQLRQRVQRESVLSHTSVWRPVRLGVLAIAASLALFFLVPLARQPGSVPALPAAVAVLPELDHLSEEQLQAVLTELDAGNDGISPMRLPRIGDLTEHQLELVLRELEG